MVFLAPYRWLLLFFIGLQAGVFAIYRDHINPDLVSMLLLAEHYLKSEWSLAICSYWGGLAVWFLAACLHLGVSALIASRLFMFISSLAMIFGSALFLEKLGATSVSINVRRITFFLLNLFFLPASIFFAPDLLLCALLTTALALQYAAVSSQSRPRPILVGSLLAFCYFTKGVGFPMGVLLASVFCFFTPRKKDFNWNFFRTKLLASFFGLAAVWIVTLSVHDGKPLFSSSGKINQAVLAPGYLEQNPWENPSFEKFLPPPPGRLTYWEDPSSQPGFPKWSALESTEALSREFDIIKNGLRQNIMLWCLAGLGILFVFLERGDKLSQFRWLFLSAALIINVGLYTPFRAIYERYYFPSILPAILIPALAFQTLGRRIPNFKKVCDSFLFIFFLAFLVQASFRAKEALFSPQTFGGEEMYSAGDAKVAFEKLQTREVDAVIGGRPEGLYLAYFLHRPWLGPRTGESFASYSAGKRILFVKQTKVDTRVSNELDENLSHYPREQIQGIAQEKFELFLITVPKTSG